MVSRALSSGTIRQLSKMMYIMLRWIFLSIVLIPKKPHPESFTDFRPICLCTFISKVLTRIVASRLSPILPKIISKEQAGFVEGRSIQDNVLLAFELLQYLDKKCRDSNVVVKLDMMKAFDRVAWPFLSAVLSRLGFPPAFVTIVMNNLLATRLSVLVNGLGVGMVSPYSTAACCPMVTHLAFADNIVIFANGASGSLKALAEVLKKYEAASGQKINFHKSFFVTARSCPSHRASAIARILGMQQSSLPFRYLGVNLFKGRNRPIFYKHLLEKIDGKLVSWHRKLLSPGGRLTLIKHVLAMIPLYTVASVMLPRQTEKAIEVKFARFFWGLVEGRPKRHWAAWSNLGLPVEEGGLGIRFLNPIQHAFSAKLYFHYLQGGTLWSEFMRASYPEHRERAAPSLTWRRMQDLTEFVTEHTVSGYSGSQVWSLSTYGNFTFSSAYNALRPTGGRCLSASGAGAAFKSVYFHVEIATPFAAIFGYSTAVWFFYALGPLPARYVRSVIHGCYWLQPDLLQYLMVPIEGLQCLCFRFEASSAMEAETLSLQLAVQCWAAFAMAPFAVEVDSLSLTNLISAQDIRIPWRIEPAVFYVRSTLCLWGSSIRHIYREANHVADALATVGLGFNTSKIFHTLHSLPSAAKLALLFDVRGFATRRSIRC
ncbi:PREDICTED: uncharacterized protein LOC109153773 [Ipomoea nil]|uniref:uncharacterized protein LOC109153773 n=1 Tax=Ipomoea nil TaxID=35883 RepID=UPI000900985F|nr:PREDICTED: uncharacterized protein LOC109153773 [Ipomoea nil]